jgi:plastocyanin
MAGILQYVLWLVLVPAISGAQDNTSTQSVDVGDNGFTYDPDTLTVSPGGEVEFHFYPGNHSVVQAAFSKPCSPMNDGSVFSGFVAPESGESVSLTSVYAL